jgi:hypothetical protein
MNRPNPSACHCKKSVPFNLHRFMLPFGIWQAYNATY